MQSAFSPQLIEVSKPRSHLSAEKIQFDFHCHGGPYNKINAEQLTRLEADGNLIRFVLLP